MNTSSRIFWFGDLNYRLNLPDSETRELVATKRWDELMNCDQVYILHKFVMQDLCKSCIVNFSCFGVLFLSIVDQ